MRDIILGWGWGMVTAFVLVDRKLGKKGRKPGRLRRWRAKRAYNREMAAVREGGLCAAEHRATKCLCRRPAAHDGGHVCGNPECKMSWSVNDAGDANVHRMQQHALAQMGPLPTLLEQMGVSFDDGGFDPRWDADVAWDTSAQS